MAAAPVVLQGLISSGEEGPGIMQTASSLPLLLKPPCLSPCPPPPLHATSQTCSPEESRTCSALPVLHNSMGCPDPWAETPPAREAQSRCQSLESDPHVLQGTLPAVGAASAWHHGPTLAWRGLELPVPHRGAGSPQPLRMPRDWAVQRGLGSGYLPAPTEVAPSQKDGTPGRDYVILISWEITCFPGTHGSRPEQGLKPPVLALHPNQGRRWAVTVHASKALPHHQPSVVPQPPLPPKVSGCSIAGHN